MSVLFDIYMPGNSDRWGYVEEDATFHRKKLRPPHNTLSKEFGSRTGQWQDTMSFTSEVIFNAIDDCMVKVERQFCVFIQTSWPKTLSGFSKLYWSLNTSFQNRKYLDVKEQTAGLLYLFTQLKWWQQKAICMHN